MLYLIAQGFWFILPALWSNMAPLWVRGVSWLEWLNRPIDANKKLLGKPIFGRNKTYRGFAAGTVFSIGIGIFQWAVSEVLPVFDRLEFFELGLSEYILLALALGFGALVGDAVESFLKRQAGIAPGETWFPMDQIDYVVGALLFSLPIGALTLGEYAAAAFVGIFLHPVGTYLGWRLGIREKPI